MPNLYELMSEYDALTEAIEEGVTGEKIDELLDAVDETRGELRDKLDNIARLMSNMEGDIAKFKAEEKRLKARRTALENNRKRLRAWVRESMDVMGVSKMKTELHRVLVTEGQPKVVVVDIDAVPEKYLRRKMPEVKLKEVLDAYKEDGEIVQGCDIVPGEKGLRIR